MKLLSVIIPVFNVEKYVETCLKSIVNQLDDDVEIVCIDDGSTDTSGIICDNYAKNYPNLKVLHQKNLGISNVRNKGISVAKGKYIAWIDSDDYVSNEWYCEIKKLLHHEFDIIFFDYMIERGKVKVPVHYSRASSCIEKSKFIFELTEDCNLQSQLWSKVIKRDLLENLFFPTDIDCMEDYALLTDLAERCNKIYYLSQCLYIYRVRANSLVTSKSLKKSWNCVKVALDRYNYFLLNNCLASKASYIFMCVSFFYWYLRSNKYLKNQYRNEFEICCAYMKQSFGTVVFNKIIFWKVKLRYQLFYKALISSMKQ